MRGLITGNDYKEIVKNLVTHPIEGLRILSELSEMGTRLGVYQKALKKGAPQQEAILESREATIDFGRIGAKSKALNMIIAFWNANVQGIDKQIRQLDFIHPENRARALKTVTRATMMITIPSLLLAYANQNDKRYQDLPEWQKDLFWIIPTENNLWRIPKPFTLGMIFGTVPEKIMNWIRTDDPKTFENIGTALLSGSLPGVVPTAALPFVESWANKSVFTGRPIVPRGKEELKPEYQYQPYTTETAKGIGKIISSLPIIGETGTASPAKIENFIRGWTGGLGNYALKLADQALKTAGITPEKIPPSKTLADIPVIKAFIARYPGTDSQAIQEFYDHYNKIMSVKQSINNLVREGRLDEVKKLQKDYATSLPFYTSGHKMQEVLANMKRFIDKIYYNPSMNPEEKRKIVDQTYLNMITISKNFNDMFKNKEIAGGMK
ncbi:MAG: LPD38 domain-containing protein [Candidatus Woesearchaeota archaeon]